MGILLPLHLHWALQGKGRAKVEVRVVVRERINSRHRVGVGVGLGLGLGRGLWLGVGVCPEVGVGVALGSISVNIRVTRLGVRAIVSAGGSCQMNQSQNGMTHAIIYCRARSSLSLSIDGEWPDPHMPVMHAPLPCVPYGHNHRCRVAWGSKPL